MAPPRGPSPASQEHLSELVPSQWGSVRLFDLCLWFGHIDTALALALHGVKGCKLEDHHLGASPDARYAAREHWHCACEGLKTCSRCCWGFPLDNGIWMQDWDANLENAKIAAKEAAKTPIVRGILEIFSSNSEVLPFTMSDQAAARLLDIAILCGNTRAAANLAKTFSVRPLRRWRGELLSTDLTVLRAALLAGAELQDLREEFDREELPVLLMAALFFHSEDWQQLGHFYSSTPWWPSRDVKLGQLLLSGHPMFASREIRIREDGRHQCWISVDKVRNALRSGWDLQHIWTEISEDGSLQMRAASALDFSILGGKSDCADALASAGVELREDCLDLLKRACRRESVDLFVGLCDNPLDLGSASECKSAAVAAAHASLRRSLKRQGIRIVCDVYHVLIRKLHREDLARALVHDILAFSMEVPEILDQLDLWDEVRGWMPSLEVKAGGDDGGAQKDLDVKEQATSYVAEEPSTLGLCYRSTRIFYMFCCLEWQCSCIVSLH